MFECQQCELEGGSGPCLAMSRWTFLGWCLRYRNWLDWPSGQREKVQESFFPVKSEVD